MLHFSFVFKIAICKTHFCIHFKRFCSTFVYFFVLMQQDYNPKDRSKSTTEWLQQKKIRLLEWPSQSSDLVTLYRTILTTLWSALRSGTLQLPYWEKVWKRESSCFPLVVCNWWVDQGCVQVHVCVCRPVYYAPVFLCLCMFVCVHPCSRVLVRQCIAVVGLRLRTLRLE